MSISEIVAMVLKTDIWNLFNFAILFFEIAVIAGCLAGTFRRNKIIGAFSFLACAFVINLATHILAYAYQRLVLGGDGRWLYDIFECISAGAKSFVGEVSTVLIGDFGKYYPLFYGVYPIGTLLAMVASVSAAIAVFNRQIFNTFRLWRAFNGDYCDILIGSNSSALLYARNNPNTVLLLDSSVDNDAEKELIEAGYTVLQRDFTVSFLGSAHLNNKTRYNFIYFDDTNSNKFFDCINEFVVYKNQNKDGKNVYLYVETEERKGDIISREIIEKSNCKQSIVTFIRKGLLAQTFAEAHPVTEFLPADFIDTDCSVKPDKKINVFVIGFGEEARELFKCYVMNNQLVKYVSSGKNRGEYKNFIIDYRIYDSVENPAPELIDGVAESMNELEKKKESYLPLPEAPFHAEYICCDIASAKFVENMCSTACDDSSFNYFIIDTSDVYSNLDITSRISDELDKRSNFRIFTRCEMPIDNKNDCIEYYGNFEDIFTHEIIVNEKLFALAKKANEKYTLDHPPKDKEPEGGGEWTTEKLIDKANKDWDDLNRFTVYSNLYQAINLRLKLHLMGFDYIDDRLCRNVKDVTEFYTSAGTSAPEASADSNKNYEIRDLYATKSVRNALLSQEHARWNAYHLLSGWLPRVKEECNLGKDKVHHRHPCLTTFEGLMELYDCIVAMTNLDKTVYHTGPDYIKNDETLLESAEWFLKEMKYSVTRR